MKLSFVIPAHNQYRLLHQLLYDIYNKCSMIHEVIVVDDVSSEEGFLNGIAWWISNGMLPIQHIRPIENLGFLKASNKGLKMATGDIVCLVSTDVRIHKDVSKFEYSTEYIVGGRYLGWDTGWNTFENKTFPYLEGWFLATYKENWEDLGFFDERYSPNDMEDIDFSTKALEVGLGLAEYPADYFTHIGAQSIGYSPERETITKINRKKFEDKWVKKVKV